MDKELANQLLNEIEALRLENLALRQYVDAQHRVREIQRTKRPDLLPAPTAHQLIEAKKRTPESVALIRELLAPVRARIQSDSTLESVISEFLRVIPSSKEEN